MTSLTSQHYYKCLKCGLRKSEAPPEVKFHCMPKDANKKNTWLQSLGLLNDTSLKINHKSTVCSLHFDVGSYVNKHKKRKLKETACPQPISKVVAMNMNHISFIDKEFPGLVRIKKLVNLRADERGTKLYEVCWLNSWLSQQQIEAIFSDGKKLIEQFHGSTKENPVAKERPKLSDDQINESMFPIVEVKIEPADSEELNSMFMCNSCNAVFYTSQNLSDHKTQCLENSHENTTELPRDFATLSQTSSTMHQSVSFTDPASRQSRIEDILKVSDVRYDQRAGNSKHQTSLRCLQNNIQKNNGESEITIEKLSSKTSLNVDDRVKDRPKLSDDQINESMFPIVEVKIEPVDTEEQDSMMFMCDSCNAVFYTSQNLSDHRTQCLENSHENATESPKDVHASRHLKESTVNEDIEIPIVYPDVPIVSSQHTNLESQNDLSRSHSETSAISGRSEHQTSLRCFQNNKKIAPKGLMENVDLEVSSCIKKCEFCDFRTIDELKLKNHTLKYHYKAHRTQCLKNSRENATDLPRDVQAFRQLKESTVNEDIETPIIYPDVSNVSSQHTTLESQNNLSHSHSEIPLTNSSSALSQSSCTIPQNFSFTDPVSRQSHIEDVSKISDVCHDQRPAVSGCGEHQTFFRCLQNNTQKSNEESEIIIEKLSSKSSLNVDIEDSSYIKQCEFCDFRTTDEFQLKNHTLKYHYRAHLSHMRRKTINTALQKLENEDMLDLSNNTSNTDVLIHESFNTEHQPKQQCSLSNAGSSKLYECHNCSMTFADIDYLARHLVRCKNPSEAKFWCELCQRGFTTKGSLDLHINHVHLKKKEFECNICGKFFARKHILQAHLDTHEGKRDFACGTCGKTFLQKGNLHRHERIHTGKNFGFKCRYCGQAFTQNRHLQKHINTQHLNIDPLVPPLILDTTNDM